MPVAPSRRASRQAGASDKREMILKAAVRTFASRGFFGAQVADVARAAGVAAGTVYLYFRGKDDLLVSIFERTMAEAIDEGRAALEGVGGAAEPAPPHRARAPRPPRPRPRHGRGLPGRAAPVHQVHGAVLLHRPARLPRRDPGRDRARGRPPGSSGPTSTRGWPPRPSSGRSTRWPPTGFSAGAATRSSPTPTPSSTCSSTEYEVLSAGCLVLSACLVPGAWCGITLRRGAAPGTRHGARTQHPAPGTRP